MTERAIIRCRFAAFGSTPEALLRASEDALKGALEECRAKAARDYPGWTEAGSEVSPVPMSVDSEFMVSLTLVRP